MVMFCACSSPAFIAHVMIMVLFSKGMKCCRMRIAPDLNSSTGISFTLSPPNIEAAFVGRRTLGSEVFASAAVFSAALSYSANFVMSMFPSEMLTVMVFRGSSDSGL